MQLKKLFSTFMAVIVLTTVTGACYNNYQVAPQELYKLNGFREGQNVELSSIEGDSFKFSSKTELSVEAVDGQRMKARYSAVEVNGNTMTGTIRGSGARVNVDLAQVNAVSTSQLSGAKTGGLIGGLGGGLLVTALVLAIVIPLVMFPNSVSSTFRR